MRILVAGREGQLARSLATLAECGDANIHCFGRPRLDVCDSNTIDRAIDDVQPDIIINTAAYTAVDQAESNEPAANAINAEGAGLIAAAAVRINAPIIHVSTDYVFDGAAVEPYSETDVVAPTSVYGRSKLAGEHAVAYANSHHIIVRTAWIISPYGKNFCKTMLHLAQDETELQVVSDQIGSPTYAPHLAEALLRIAGLVFRNREASPWGNYHIANTGYATWYDVAGAIMEAAEKLDLKSARVRAISSEHYKTTVRRPANSRLDCNKAKRNFGIELPSWQRARELCVSELADNQCT